MIIDAQIDRLLPDDIEIQPAKLTAYIERGDPPLSIWFAPPLDWDRTAVVALLAAVFEDADAARIRRITKIDRVEDRQYREAAQKLSELTGHALAVIEQHGNIYKEFEEVPDAAVHSVEEPVSSTRKNDDQPDGQMVSRLGHILERVLSMDQRRTATFIVDLLRGQGFLSTVIDREDQIDSMVERLQSPDIKSIAW